MIAGEEAKRCDRCGVVMIEAGEEEKRCDRCGVVMIEAFRFERNISNKKKLTTYCVWYLAELNCNICYHSNARLLPSFFIWCVVILGGIFVFWLLWCSNKPTFNST